MPSRSTRAKKGSKRASRALSSSSTARVNLSRRPSLDWYDTRVVVPNSVAQQASSAASQSRRTYPESSYGCLRGSNTPLDQYISSPGAANRGQHPDSRGYFVLASEASTGASAQTHHYADQNRSVYRTNSSEQSIRRRHPDNDDEDYRGFGSTHQTGEYQRHYNADAAPVQSPYRTTASRQPFNVGSQQGRTTWETADGRNNRNVNYQQPHYHYEPVRYPSRPQYNQAMVRFDQTADQYDQPRRQRLVRRAASEQVPTLASIGRDYPLSRHAGRSRDLDHRVEEIARRLERVELSDQNVRGFCGRCWYWYGSWVCACGIK